MSFRYDCVAASDTAETALTQHHRRRHIAQQPSHVDRVFLYSHFMDILAYILCGTLIVIGLVHLLWALGSTWPCKDEVTLAKTVVGSRGIEKMPPRWASLFVALCLFAASYWALALRGLAPVKIPQLFTVLGGLVLAGVFGARGVFGVLPAFERLSPEQPFLKLNRRIYSPLCFLIGAGFALLVLSIPNWTWRLSA